MGEAGVRNMLQAGRWGSIVLYLVAIAFLVTNNTSITDLQPWQQALLAVLASLVVAAVVVRTTRPYLLPLLGIIAIPCGTFAVYVVGMVSLAIRRNGAGVWWVAAAGTAASLAFILMQDLAAGYGAAEVVTTMVFGFILLGLGPLLVGGYVRIQRQRTADATARAHRAELERELSVERALHEERERTAQEMHDSLGHVLTIITMQAGALEVQTKDTETANAAAAIRESARSGLRELRSLVHVLGADERRDPLPCLGMISELVASSNKAGAAVELTIGPDVDDSLVPLPIGRLAFNVVQEGLTNAHRHAPGSPVRVSLAIAGTDLVVEVTNALAPGGERGAGTGLARLQRRAALLGGTVDAIAAYGRFTLRATLPCQENP